jgi:5-methylcytosine-specific restriction enzyme subunit McrC
MELRLTEWQRAEAGPDHPELRGLFLDDPAIQRVLQNRPLDDHLLVSECRHGLVIEARQHVGVLQLGPLRICIRPKMAVRSLWPAVTYALGLDDLVRHEPVELDLLGDFADLLAMALVAESERLWRRGIQRGYRETSEWRAHPRGRPDVVALARSGPLTRAALPCRHHEFTADVVENQVVLAGLALARGVSSHLPLRSALHRAHQQWSTVCRQLPLSGALLDAADRARNRLTARYAGVHRLVRLLHERSGLDDEHEQGSDTLPGFLWNMADLFERFVARFLSEHLPEYEVTTQSTLRDLYRVVSGRPGLQAPRPRPDLLLRRRADSDVIAVLDTKYRDLWATSLPREILYQMSVYSLAWSEAKGQDVPAVVLYPAVGGTHPDAVLHLQVDGGKVRRIVLRAVDWAAAAEVSGAGSRTAGERLARLWVG